jgi:hypothetical protein
MSIKEKTEQCLFLVAESGNMHDQHAVMLHDGERKIGSLNKVQAPAVKAILDSWVRPLAGKSYNQEDVIVVSVPYLLDDSDYSDTSDMYDELKRSQIVKVKGIYRVNERLARKFSDQYLKE